MLYKTLTSFSESETHEEELAVLSQEHLSNPHSSGIEKWNTEEVSDWLSRLDLDKPIINAFKEEKVTGDILKTLTRDEIKEIYPHAKCGDWKRIINARD